MLQNFVLSFQAKKPQPLVYIRTLLQNYLFKDMVLLGRLSIRQVFDDDLSIVVLPCSRLLDPANDKVESPNDPRFAIAHQMEMFRQRAAPVLPRCIPRFLPEPMSCTKDVVSRHPGLGDGPGRCRGA